MAININDNLMSLEVNGKAIATAREQSSGWWVVSCWPRFLVEQAGQGVTPDAQLSRAVRGVHLPPPGIAGWLDSDDVDHRSLRPVRGVGQVLGRRLVRARQSCTASHAGAQN